jgi:hypothetical protein
MATAEVIPARRWVNSVTGQTASIYGAAPYGGDRDRVNWSIKDSGFTIRHPNGTVGCGRLPFDTREEAESWIDRNAGFAGY